MNTKINAKWKCAKKKKNEFLKYAHLFLRMFFGASNIILKLSGVHIFARDDHSVIHNVACGVVSCNVELLSEIAYFYVAFSVLHTTHTSQ